MTQIELTFHNWECRLIVHTHRVNRVTKLGMLLLMPTEGSMRQVFIMIVG